jgi:hypothetical protein
VMRDYLEGAFYFKLWEQIFKDSKSKYGVKISTPRNTKRNEQQGNIDGKGIRSTEESPKLLQAGFV